MGLHSNTSSNEFIAYLRERAIANNAPSVVVDKIDSLGDVEGLESELEAFQGQIDDLAKDKNQLRDELATLIEAASGFELMDTEKLRQEYADELEVALQNARDTLERTGT